jgi:hypothetical protein
MPYLNTKIKPFVQYFQNGFNDGLFRAFTMCSFGYKYTLGGAIFHATLKCFVASMGGLPR